MTGISSDPAFTVRPYQTSDLIGLLQCTLSLRKDAGDRKVYGESWSDETLKGWIAEPALIWVLLTPTQKIAGFLFLQEVAQDIQEVLALGVEPGYRGQGGAKLLLRTSWSKFSQVREPQVRERWLEVHENNRSARSLYEGLGFQKVGRREGYYEDQGAALLYTQKGSEV